MQYKTIIKTIYQLLKTDLFKFFKNTFVSDVFNKSIWITCSIAIANYIWPNIGMSESFGSFMAIGAIVSCIYWDCWGVSVQFIADLEGNNTTQYYLSLPIPAAWYFVKQALFYAIRALIPAVCILPLIKIILWHKLSLAHVQFLPFALVMITTSFFGAALSLFVTSRVRDMNSIDNISIRFLFPLWFFGGSQFSWYTLLNISPLFAKLCLLNPLLYAMESIRVVFLGQEGYLPFWTSIGVLWLFNLVIGIYGARSLIKRLDCV